ncbi:MAG: M28 family peptidase, partial [Bacteroidales bacterium]|nr:M28 family peptidase [Bacteroidales bacterium]
MRKIFVLLFLCLLEVPVLTGQNDPVVDRIIKLGITENKVMDHIDFLTNRFGERMTGSDNYYSACVWAVNTMRSWGMMAEMQEAGELPVGFNRGPWWGRMVSPAEMSLEFGTPAYTAGTKGKQKGHVVIAPKTVEEFWKMKDSIRNAWVLIDGVNTGWPRDRGGESELTALIREAGALGTIQLSSFPVRVLYHKVESWDKLPVLPDIKLIDKQYNEIKSLVEKGQKVELEFDIRNYFRPGPVKYHNVIAWIPGTKYPDEYVILGGHLDGLAGATAAVDNASGAAPSMEAARLIMASGGK